MPGVAGFSESTRRLEESTIAPCPVPCCLTLNIAGAKAIRSRTAGALLRPLAIAVSDTFGWPESSQGSCTFACWPAAKNSGAGATALAFSAKPARLKGSGVFDAEAAELTGKCPNTETMLPGVTESR